MNKIYTFGFMSFLLANWVDVFLTAYAMESGFIELNPFLGPNPSNEYLFWVKGVSMTLLCLILFTVAYFGSRNTKEPLRSRLLDIFGGMFTGLGLGMIVAIGLPSAALFL